MPQSLSEVGKAMGILQRDTTLTGTGLENLSRLLLTASRLTGSDSAVAAESAAKAMSVWGVAAKDGGQMLEKFFAASRAGGVNMGDLMKRMAQFGMPMQQMGLSFEQSMVLMAKWQKEGMNPIEDALKKKYRMADSPRSRKICERLRLPRNWPNSPWIISAHW